MGIDWWQIWLLLGIVLFVAEIFTPGFLLACVGLACIAAFLPAVFGLGLEWQLGTFIVSFIIVLLTLRPWFLKNFRQARETRPTNTEALIGMSGRVSSTEGGALRIKAHGDDWAAVCRDGRDLEAGSEVEIIGIDGVKLVVRRKKSFKELY